MFNDVDRGCEHKEVDLVFAGVQETKQYGSVLVFTDNSYKGQSNCYFDANIKRVVKHCLSEKQKAQYIDNLKCGDVLRVPFIEAIFSQISSKYDKAVFRRYQFPWDSELVTWGDRDVGYLATVCKSLGDNE